MRGSREASFLLIGSVLLISGLSCTDESKKRIREFFDSEVSIECQNECVDGAPALLMEVKAVNGTGDFPSGVSWFSEWNLVEPVWIESLGPAEYCVTFRFDPPVPLHDQVRVGARIEPSYVDFLMKEAVFLSSIPPEPELRRSPKPYMLTACDNTPPCPPAPGTGLLVNYDLSMGLVLEVFNAADSLSGPVTLHELQWTTATDTVPSNQLVWGDSLLESLPWLIPIPNLPLILYPNQPPLIVDIPDSALLQADVVLFRSYSSASTMLTRGVFQTQFAQTVQNRPTSWGRIKSLFE